MSNSSYGKELLNLLVVLCFAALGATSRLADLDLGWHLVGGLSIIDNLSLANGNNLAAAVPKVDFIASGGAEWIAYSWLAEISFAWILLQFGFSGLYLLQALLVFISALSIYNLFKSSSASPLTSSLSFASSLVPILAFLVSVPLLLPVWYLRPQLISLILFTLLLSLAESEKLTVLRVSCLTLLWANVHTFWVFVPVVTLLYSFRKMRVWQALLFSAYLALLGAVSPYGWKNIEVLFSYVFRHREGYLLIREFQPALKDWNLVSAVYLIVWVLVIVGGFLAEKGHSEESQDERSQAEKSQSEKAMARGLKAVFLPIPGLFLLFAAAAAMQIKYMPFFAVVSGVALCKYCLPELCWRSSNRRVGELEQNQLVTPGLGIKFGCFLAAFSLVMLCGLKLDLMKPGLEAAALALPGDSDGVGGSSIALSEARRVTAKDPFEQLLLHAAAMTKFAAATGEVRQYNVLNHFDDGGWLAFAFYLTRPVGRLTSDFRLTVDGRTLVMGADRLRDFGSLIAEPNSLCSYIAKTDSSFALLRQDSALGRVFREGLLQSSPELSCLREWRLAGSSKHWIVASRVGATFDES